MCNRTQRASETVLAALGLVTLLVAGCAQVKPAGDYERARELVQSTTGTTELFNPDKSALSPEEIAAILSNGLSLREAERVALLNNRELQMACYEIGVANADWVQAGLLTNPLLIFSAQFPDGGGRSDIQATIAQNIVDLWQIPVKRQVANAARDAAILRIARQAGVLMADVRGQYYRTVASDRLYAIATDNLDLVRQSYDAIKGLREAGTASEFDENLARGHALTAQVGMQNARLEAADSKRRLAAMLSLDQNFTAVELLDGFATAAQSKFDAESLIEMARSGRLDLKSLAAKADTAEAKLRLEWRKIIPEIWVGPFLERKDSRALPGRNLLADTGRASVANGAPTAPDIQSRGQRNEERRQEINNLLGPAITMPIPIFDQNQAQIAKAQFEYEQAVKALEDQSIKAAQTIRTAVEHVSTAASVAKLYETEIVPQARRNQEFARTALAAGRANVLGVIEAQRSLLDARRGQLLAEAELAASLASLELNVGQPLTDGARKSDLTWNR